MATDTLPVWQALGRKAMFQDRRKTGIKTVWLQYNHQLLKKWSILSSYPDFSFFSSQEKKKSHLALKNKEKKTKVRIFVGVDIWHKQNVLRGSVLKEAIESVKM